MNNEEEVSLSQQSLNNQQAEITSYLSIQGIDHLPVGNSTEQLMICIWEKEISSHHLSQKINILTRCNSRFVEYITRSCI